MIEVEFDEVVEIEEPSAHRSQKKYTKEQIDYILERTSFEAVLEFFNFEMRPQKHDEVIIFCPFHDDRKNPNLNVNVEKNVYFCFSCGAKGDVTDFVSKTMNLGFFQSISLIAKICGIAELDEDDIMNRRLDNLMKEKVDTQKRILGMTLEEINIALSSTLGDCTIKNKEMAGYCESVSVKLDEWLETEDEENLKKLMKKLPEILKKRLKRNDER